MSKVKTIHNKNMAKIFCLFLIFASTQIMMQTISLAPAFGETRTLWLYITQTKESDKITYKQNGRYLKSGLKRLNYLLRDFRQNESIKMDPELFDLLWQVYRKSGSKRAIHVVSGYRSPKTNNLLRKKGHKVAKHSKHLTGKAIDFYLPDVPIKRLQVLGLREHKGGVGYYKGSFVHLDTGGVRHWPALSKRQLSKVFPNGQTIHLPKNKKPLKNYELADANLRKGLFYDGRQDIDNNPQSLISRLLGLENSTPIDDDIEIALLENIPQQNFDVSDEIIYSASLANVKTIPTPTKRPEFNIASESQINLLLENNITNNQQPKTISAYVPIPTTKPLVAKPLEKIEAKIAAVPLPKNSPTKQIAKTHQPFLPLSYENTLSDIQISLGKLTSNAVKNWALSPNKISNSHTKLQAPNFNANLLATTNIKIVVNKNLLTNEAIIAYNKKQNKNGE